MSNLPNPPKTINPLWIIFMFFSFTEMALGVVTFNTTGGIQVALTVFVIGFPLLVVIGFFIVLWSRPEHLYAPKDFSDDDKFLQGLESSRSARESLVKLQEKIKKQTESKVTEKDLDKFRQEILSQLDKTLYELDPTSALIFIPRSLEAEQRKLHLFGFKNLHIYDTLQPSFEGIVILEIQSLNDEITFRQHIQNVSPKTDKTAFILYARFGKRPYIEDETMHSYENLYVANTPVALANFILLALRTLAK